MATVQTDTARSGNGAATSAADIETQLKQLRDDLGSLASAVAAAGAEKTDSYKARAGEMASHVKDASSAALHEVGNELASLQRKVKGGVRERPLQAVGLALVAGFALALLARR